MKHWLFLIRHGETTWNVEHRLPGQLPGIELTGIGREQAKRLAQALKTVPFTAIISSPLERAIETARYIAEGRNLTIQLEPDLMDIDLGGWTGQNRDELSQHDPVWQAFLRNPLLGPEGVETFPAVEKRAVAAVERWLHKESTGPCVAFVTHSDVIKLLIAHYEDLELGKVRRVMIENASASVIELIADHRPRIHAVGWSPQPFWLEPSTFVQEQPKSEEHIDGEQYG